MPAPRPTVSIGLPVYNGAQYLRQTLDSVLAQEYEDFELIIADNASTDETGDIAIEYAARDHRIRYDRAEKNRGSRWNFNRVCMMASGKYFIWASCHDLWAPGMLRRCVETMEQDDSVVLCFSRAAEIDADGNRLGTLRGQLDTRGMDRIARFKKTVRQVPGYAVYGVHRTSALRQVMPLRISLGPDAVALAELSFLGAFAFLPDLLFYHRRLSVSRNWRRYFENLHLKLSLWNFLRLYGRFIADYLAIARKYATCPSERASLSAWTVTVLLARTFLWGLGIIVSLFLPRYYRPW